MGMGRRAEEREGIDVSMLGERERDKGYAGREREWRRG